MSLLPLPLAQVKLLGAQGLKSVLGFPIVTTANIWKSEIRTLHQCSDKIGVVGRYVLLEFEKKSQLSHHYFLKKFVYCNSIEVNKHLVFTKWSFDPKL